MKCKNCGSSIVPIQEVGPGFQGKGWCAYCADSMPDPKDARIAALEAALAKAEEALEIVDGYWDPLQEGTFCSCCGERLSLERDGHAPHCKRQAALAAIGEVKK